MIPFFFPQHDFFGTRRFSRKFLELFSPLIMTKRVFSSLAKAFEIIARSRNAERNFSEQHIHKSTLRKLLELSQLAPSSFNMQPYKLIVVSAEQRLSLSSGMLGGNADIVSKAPVSIVFLADKGKL